VSIFKIHRRQKKHIVRVQPPIEGAVILYQEQVRYPDGTVRDVPPQHLPPGNPFFKRPEFC